MRQLDYADIFWMLLPVEWEIFGIALFVSMLSLWIDLRFREKNIDVSEGSSFFCKAFIHPSDAGKTIEVDLGSKQSVFVIDAAHVIFYCSRYVFRGKPARQDEYARLNAGAAQAIGCHPAD